MVFPSRPRLSIFFTLLAACSAFLHQDGMDLSYTWIFYSFIGLLTIAISPLIIHVKLLVYVVLKLALAAFSRGPSNMNNVLRKT